MNYHSTVMRPLACVLLIPLCLMAQNPQSPKPFPIPEDMQEDWPGAGLGEAETKLLQKAVQADLLEVEADCETKLSLDRVEMAGVSLGKLGKGVVVRMAGSCVCGATGNCPLRAYAPRKGGYRLVADGGMGWAFGVVDSKAAVPGLVFASNGGGGQASLGLYRYVGDRYLLQACETLIKKDRADASWWDPSAVVVQTWACGAPSTAPATKPPTKSAPAKYATTEF